MSNQSRAAALQPLIGHCVEIRRGDVRLASGNLLGPLDMVRKGRRRMWGAAYGEEGRLHVAAFDPQDVGLVIHATA